MKSVNPQDLPCIIKDNEIVHILTDAGVSLPAARVLVFLIYHPGATAAEIGKGTDMFQQQVNVTLPRMKERGWITVRRKREGHHIMQFFLAQPFDAIIADIEREIMSKDALNRDRIRRLREGLG
jgi:predicted transcriptional regulator